MTERRVKPPTCPPCRAQRQRWLDYRLPPVRGFTHGSGAPYDGSTAGIRDARHARYEQWRSTVRFQMDLIAKQCRTGRHVDVEEAPGCVIQLDLLGAIDDLQGGA
jgi:hypothetical protein